MIFSARAPDDESKEPKELNLAFLPAVFLNSQKFRTLCSEHFQTAFLQQKSFLPQCPKAHNLHQENEDTRTTEEVPFRFQGQKLVQAFLQAILPQSP